MMKKIFFCWGIVFLLLPFLLRVTLAETEGKKVEVVKEEAIIFENNNSGNASKKEEIVNPFVKDVVQVGTSILDLGKVSLKAVIKSKNQVKINKSIIFSVDDSYLNNQENLKFYWELGDGQKKEGKEVIHSYSNFGGRTVKLEVVTAEGEKLVDTKEIFVYKNKFVWLWSYSNKDITEFVNGLKNNIEKEWVLINSLDLDVPVGSSNIDDVNIVKDVNNLVFLIKDLIDVNKIIALKSLGIDFDSKNIFIIYEENLTSLSKLAQNVYNLLQPKTMLAFHQEAIHSLLSSENVSVFFSDLFEKKYDFKKISEDTSRVTPFNFMSYLINWLVVKGVPVNVLYLLLMLGLMSTLLAFLKQVIGISAFGIYIPTMITLSLIELGWKQGLVTFCLIFITGVLSRKLLKRLNLLFIPNTAAILSIISLVIILAIALGVYSGLITAEYFATVSVFPILVMILSAEKFINVRSSKGFKVSAFLLIETMLISVGGYFLIDFAPLKNFYFIHPELLIFLIFFNILLGRWKGLRVLELYRFRRLIFRNYYIDRDDNDEE